MFDPGQKRNQCRQEKRARARQAQGFSLKKDKFIAKFLTPDQMRKAAQPTPPRNPELENIRRFKAGSNHFVYQKGD